MELNGWGVVGFVIGFIFVCAVNPTPTDFQTFGGGLFFGWLFNAFGASRG